MRKFLVQHRLKFILHFMMCISVVLKFMVSVKWDIMNGKSFTYITYWIILFRVKRYLWNYNLILYLKCSSFNVIIEICYGLNINDVHAVNGGKTNFEWIPMHKRSIYTITIIKTCSQLWQDTLRLLTNIFCFNNLLIWHSKVGKLIELESLSQDIFSLSHEKLQFYLYYFVKFSLGTTIKTY